MRDGGKEKVKVKRKWKVMESLRAMGLHGGSGISRCLYCKSVKGERLSDTQGHDLNPVTTGEKASPAFMFH